MAQQINCPSCGAELETRARQISNGPVRECSFCLRPQNNFYTDLYPELQRIQASGTQVICIGGDAGTYVPYFEHRTADGIFFLASGMNHEQFADGEALIFQHDREQRVLNWEITRVDDLPRR